MKKKVVKKKSVKKRDKNKKFSLKEQYKLSWNYIQETKNFIWLVILFFIISALIGFFIPAPESFVQKILEYIAELLEKTAGMSGLELTGFIFLNNLQSSFGVVIFGFVFGLVPIIATLANGYVIGFVASMTVNLEGIVFLWRLLPHGIFELPAIFISLGMGVKFGTFIFQKDKIESFKEFFWNSLRVFIFVVIPLLIIGAIIEGSLISLGW